MTRGPEAAKPDAVIGMKWGDEAKGRWIDYLANNASYVARYNGGDNAGHSVTFPPYELQLHLIPSGILTQATCLIGREVAFNPNTFLEEKASLEAKNIDISPTRIMIDEKTLLVLLPHILNDVLQEAQTGQLIGTTLRGIGPAYADRRIGPRIRDLYRVDFEEYFKSFFDNKAEILKAMARNHNVHQTLEKLKDEAAGKPHKQRALELLSLAISENPINTNMLIAELDIQRKLLKPYIGDTVQRVWDDYHQGKKGMYEGAQGNLIDLTLATPPFVTYSHPGVLGITESFNMTREYLDRVVGATKAFDSRVGEGPFPTELKGEEANTLRGTGENPWDEFGTTTRRPRRVGWLDGVLLEYSVRTNGASELAVAKLDILGQVSPKLCVAYDYGLQRINQIHRIDTGLLKYVTPVYREFDRWEIKPEQIDDWEDLPKETRKYLDAVGEVAGIPVTMASFGAGRNQAIFRGFYR